MLAASDQSSSQDYPPPWDYWDDSNLVVFASIEVALDNCSATVVRLDNLKASRNTAATPKMLLLGTVQGSGYLLADKVLSTAQSLVVQLTCTLAMAGVENQTTSMGSSALCPQNPHAPVSGQVWGLQLYSACFAGGRQRCTDKDMAQRLPLVG